MIEQRSFTLKAINQCSAFVLININFRAVPTLLRLNQVLNYLALNNKALFYIIIAISFYGLMSFSFWFVCYIVLFLGGGGLFIFILFFQFSAQACILIEHQVELSVPKDKMILSNLKTI